MQSEIAVSQKHNTAMVCKCYENKSRCLWFYALHSHYHHFKPYSFDIFLIFFFLSKMKKHCFDIIKISKATNVLTHNKPLNRTAVIFFTKKCTASSSPQRSSTSFHELLADLLNAIYVSVNMCLVKANVKTFILGLHYIKFILWT